MFPFCLSSLSFFAWSYLLVHELALESLRPILLSLYYHFSPFHFFTHIINILSALIVTPLFFFLSCTERAKLSTHSPYSYVYMLRSPAFRFTQSRCTINVTNKVHEYQWSFALGHTECFTVIQSLRSSYTALSKCDSNLLQTPMFSLKLCFCPKLQLWQRCLTP